MPIATWSGRAASRALRRIRSEGRRHATPCCLCGQRINYDLTYPHPQSCSVQHIKSRNAYPHLTWDPNNWAPAHLVCNQSQGATSHDDTSLGLTSL